jgi:hypothetical protein
MAADVKQRYTTRNGCGATEEVGEWELHRVEWPVTKGQEDVEPLELGCSSGAEAHCWQGVPDGRPPPPSFGALPSSSSSDIVSASPDSSSSSSSSSPSDSSPSSSPSTISSGNALRSLPTSSVAVVLLCLFLWSDN